jgi:arabinofuranosyltransferase
MTSTLNIKILTYTCIALAIALFIKNFWFTEDIFLLFRILEQMQAGHGPVWNAGVRCQVFTSVGWFLVTVIFNLLVPDVFISTILANTCMFLLFLYVAKRIFGTSLTFCIFILMLLPSISFYDHTSSGLDNAFGFTFIAFLYYIYRNQNGFTDKDLPLKSFFVITFLTANIAFARYDFILMSIPPFLYTIWRYRPRLSILVKAGILASLPLLIWSSLSVFYYGKPLPNTAYTKLFHGYPEDYLLTSGINFFKQHLVADPYTMAVIFLGFAGSMLFLETWKKAFAVGMLAHLAYQVIIGGDYMFGRFMSYTFLVSALLLTDVLHKFLSSPEKKGVLVKIFLPLLLLLGLIVPENPVITPWGYGRNIPWEKSQDVDVLTRGVINMRKVYYQTSAAAWYYDELRAPMSRELTDVRAGLDIKKFGEKVVVIGATGATGYYAGIDVHLIDNFGLTDPFISMLPAIQLDFTSHFRREIPDGYVETFLDENARIKDPKLDELYRHIKLITTSKDLFAPERLKAIYNLNTGKYDYLLEDYKKDVFSRRDMTPHIYNIWDMGDK